MKSDPEMQEGPQAWKKFDRAVGTLLSVSHDELLRREREYQERAKHRLSRRGRKRKAKS